MADRVDAAVEAVEATGANPSQHCIIAQPRFMELPNRDNPMLLLGYTSYGNVGRVEFLGHIPTKSPRRRFLPPSHDLYAEAGELHAVLIRVGA